MKLNTTPLYNDFCEITLLSMIKKIWKILIFLINKLKREKDELLFRDTIQVRGSWNKKFTKEGLNRKYRV